MTMAPLAELSVVRKRFGAIVALDGLSLEVRRGELLAVAGGRAIDPELAAEAWTEADPLTDRERQILRLAADGRSGPEIAAELRLSEGTVRNYLSDAISKVGGRIASTPRASRARRGGSELEAHLS